MEQPAKALVLAPAPQYAAAFEPAGVLPRPGRRPFLPAAAAYALMICACLLPYQRTHILPLLPHIAAGPAQAAADEPFCRICHGAAVPDNPLLSPCRCRGTMAHVHGGCLAAWKRASGRARCDVCGALWGETERRGQAPREPRQPPTWSLAALALASSLAMYGLAALAAAAEERQQRAYRQHMRQQQQQAVRRGLRMFGGAAVVGAALRAAAGAARLRRPPPPALRR